MPFFGFWCELTSYFKIKKFKLCDEYKSSVVIHNYFNFDFVTCTIEQNRFQAIDKYLCYKVTPSLSDTTRNVTP
jgi:hypothetical protein